MRDIPTTYDQSKEADIYKLWEQSGFFNPDNLEGKPYTIIMPPSNANGQVHVGHALGFTLQDIMIRFERMRGRKTLYLPGTDHAGFETQVVFEKKLDKEGRSRFQMTREEFYKETWAFVQANKKLTEDSIRRLGASVDWSRNMFTLDPRVIKIVYETFEQMYNDGLIYPGNRICNWCVKHQTGLSDLETEHEERTDPLYYIKYGPLTVATVRPETIFGDVALAVNPKDSKYNKYLGRPIILPEKFIAIFGNNLLIKKVSSNEIPVISDDAVEPEFGTGVVKITPSHDQLDFEIWGRHKEEIPSAIQIIDNRGRIDLKDKGFRPDIVERYHGKKVAEARKLIIEQLQDNGLIEWVDENYKHNVLLCYKCRTVLEPLVIPQWYVAMNKPGKSLRDAAVEAVKNGKVKIIPEARKKVFMNWMENIRDWPISRQIWWGIPIPVWYKENNDPIPEIATLSQEEKRKILAERLFIRRLGEKTGLASYKIHIGATPPDDGDWIQDPDTLDTWFSSGQWPYATLKALSEKDFETFYPTQTMETGWDILFFWVARMIMFGLYKTGKVPFENVYLHGLVRDKDRQKMSKSKGNVIDPLGVIDTYGNDALRMALVVGNLPGNDLPLSEDKVRGYRNFANKIWNAARFVMQNTEDMDPKAKLDPAHKTIIKDLDKLAKDITKLLDKQDLAHAAENLYHYFWHTFADKTIEEAKTRLADEKTKASTQRMLKESLDTLLKLLHPFTPFVTETIWQMEHKNLLLVEKWPGKK